MFDEARALPNLIRAAAEPFDWGEHGVRRALTPLEILSANRVLLVGNGDSYHAALACQRAVNEFARVPCQAFTSLAFAAYAADVLPVPFPNDPLVVGVSVSGRSSRTVEAVERAAAAGANTLAMTGTPDSPITQSARRRLYLQIPPGAPAPGIRSYTATVMGLLLLAIRLGEIRNRYHQEAANALRGELARLADVIAGALDAADAPARAAVDLCAASPMLMCIGSGPSYGTALFTAAKFVEGAGLFAVGQDIEEWLHVERFARPNDMPLWLVAPPGASYARAAHLAATARAIGHRLIAVVQDDDMEIARHADVVFPIPGTMREAFSPLVYHVAAHFFAAHLAEALGRKPFQSDNAAYWSAPDDAHLRPAQE
jgi:glucosamine--fructose-6-phosphate aminotransferase (isomerizing)